MALSISVRGRELAIEELQGKGVNIQSIDIQSVSKDLVRGTYGKKRISAGVITETTSKRLRWSAASNVVKALMSEWLGGAISLLVWVSKHGIHVMQLPIPEFSKPRDSIGLETINKHEWNPNI